MVTKDRTIHGVSVEPLLDLFLAKAEESNSLIPGELVDAISSRISEIEDPDAVIVTSKRSRAYVRDIVKIHGGRTPVLAHDEIAPRYQVVSAGVIEISNEAQRAVLVNAGT